MTETTRASSLVLPSQVAAAVCLLVGCYGYVSGWDAWLILLLILVIPVAWLFVWLYSGRLKRYRFLVGIYSVAGAVALFEAWQHGQIPEAFAESLDLPMGRGKPNLYFEYDLPGVQHRLFPDHPDSLMIRGIQSSFCIEEKSPFRNHPFCDEYTDAEIRVVRELFEKALAQEPKSSEDIYYHYVQILIRDGSRQSEIDAAADKWRRLFPLSERHDPRDVFRGQRRSE